MTNILFGIILKSIILKSNLAGGRDGKPFRGFLESYLSLLMREATAFDRMVRFVRETLPGFRVEVQINESGSPSLSLGYARTD